jgi:hypothetical protein
VFSNRLEVDVSWIIQRLDFKGEKPVMPPDYYAGPVPAGQEHTSWTRNKDDALRFARDKDALTFAAHGFFCNVKVLPCTEDELLAKAA